MSLEGPRLSSQERKTLDSLTLTHSDLVTTKRFSGPFIEPKEIPVHPLVYDCPAVYTHDFVDRVRTTIPNSIKDDIEAIRGKIGDEIWDRLVGDKPLPLVQNSTPDRDIMFLGRFSFEVNPQRQVWINAPGEAVNLALDRTRPDIRIIFLPFDYPTPKRKLKRYTVNPEKYPNDYDNKGIIGWYAHNFSMASLSTKLYLRNFAIQFNNLGLQEVASR